MLTVIIVNEVDDWKFHARWNFHRFYEWHSSKCYCLGSVFGTGSDHFPFTIIVKELRFLTGSISDTESHLCYE